MDLWASPQQVHSGSIAGPARVASLLAPDRTGLAPAAAESQKQQNHLYKCQSLVREHGEEKSKINPSPFPLSGFFSLLRLQTFYTSIVTSIPYSGLLKTVNLPFHSLFSLTHPR